MLGCQHRRALRLLEAWVVFALTACSGLTDVPIEREPARLVISANVAATTIQTMVVTVTGPGIATPLVFNLVIDDAGRAGGSVAIPAGVSRKIELDAFDAKGIKTHHGERTIAEVTPGENPGVSIVLLPLAGNQPITATLGSFSITVAPSSATVMVGASNAVTFVAIVRDKDDAIVTVPPGELRWATTNPALFSVVSHPTDSDKGVVTGILAGSGDVVVTYKAFAGLATVTVVP